MEAAVAAPTSLLPDLVAGFFVTFLIAVTSQFLLGSFGVLSFHAGAFIRHLRALKSA
jgi:ABC-type transporter Mla maintaining outer membrane lipid asymmetry permease subunit MlaE